MNLILLWLVVIPFVGAVICPFLPSNIAKTFSLGVSFVGVGLAAVLFVAFRSESGMQLQLTYPWIESLKVNFALGVDGLSFLLVILTKFMMPIALLASFGQTQRLSMMLGCFLLLDAAMTGTFLATDLFLFYVFWELMLVPMILLIGIWGSQNRVFASLKFFLFTFAGSVLMLAALFWVFSAHYAQHGFYTGEIRSLYGLAFPSGNVFLGLTIQDLIFLGFTIAFAVKVPLFPFHTWLPDAHVQAPTGGSILLAAVLLKMGTYGLLRFSIPICPQSFSTFAPGLAGLSLIGIVYGAWVAFQQSDVKKLVAYSSVSHLGFVVLGICSKNVIGLTGALLQMVNHGLTTGALFLMIGMLYERRHSREFSAYGGLAAIVPWFAFFFVFVSCASMAVPGLNGFVGEFLILLGTFQSDPRWAAIAVLGVVFGALYTLWMVRGILFGRVTVEENHSLKDMVAREWVALVPLCIGMVLIGVQPHLLLDKVKPALEAYWSGILSTGIAVGMLP